MEKILKRMTNLRRSIPRKKQNTLTEMQTNQNLTIPPQKTSTKTLMMSIKMEMLEILMKK